MNYSRRSFLKQAAFAASVPLLLPASTWAADSAPGSQITVGFIGMGKQSRGLLHGFQGQRARVLAVCDVDTTRREDARKKVDEHNAANGISTKCAAYNDYREIIKRKDINTVCIATPDHWHAIIALDAIRAGKDVYCEKPLTHNIAEAVELMKVVQAHKRILQTGSMQRSMREFRVACELVRNGVIGDIQRIECSFGDPGVPCDLPEEPLEPGLDWDMWLGPAQKRPYNSILSPRGMHDHYPDWRNYREFGGGMVTDWGAHHLDIAQWGLGMDESGPVEVLPSPVPNAKRGVKLIYANGVPVEHKNGFGVIFFGSEGEVRVNRSRFVFIHGKDEIASFTGQNDTVCALEVKKAEDAFLKNPKVRLYDSSNHIADFLNCVKSRRKPITNEIVGGRTVICCHLMNLAYYHGQKILWDPVKMKFRKDGDPDWLTREYRSPWHV